MIKTIIWGTGKYGKQIYMPLIEKHEADIIAYVDNNVKKWGGTVL